MWKGNILVVWRLDQLGRSLPQLVATVRQLGEEGIDTTTAAGTLVLHVFRALTQFERNLIREWT